VIQARLLKKTGISTLRGVRIRALEKTFFPLSELGETSGVSYITKKPREEDANFKGGNAWLRYKGG